MREILLKIRSNDRETYLLLILSVFFILWGFWFIFLSSFVVDGVRHFLIIDDGMISFRYALNLVNGNGLVWNTGEYIEGFTNPLWTMVMALSIFIFGQNLAPLIIQLLGLTLLLFSGFYIYSIVQILNKKFELNYRYLSLLPSFLFWAYYPISYWSIGGMEVSLLTFLLVALTYYCLKHILENEDEHIYYKIFTFLSIAYITRPDGFLSMLPLLLAVLFNDYASNKKINFYSLIKSSIIFVVAISLVILFRYMYYGDFVPNTYHLKIDGYDLLWRLENGFGFIKLFLLEMSVFIFISSFFALKQVRESKNYLWIFLIMIPFIILAYQVYVGGDPWNKWRQLSPSIFIYFILFYSFLAFTLKNNFEKKHIIFYFVFIGFVNLALVLANVHLSRIFIIVFAFIHVFFFALLFLAKKRYSLILLTIFGLALADTRHTQEHLVYDGFESFSWQAEMAEFAFNLNEITKDGFEFGVIWAGTIPYYTKGHSIDFLGKSDKHISNLKPRKTPSWDGMDGVPGHAKYDLDYSIKTLQPDWIQSFKFWDQNLAEYAKDNYVKLSYKDNEMMGCFKKDSMNIDWNKINVNGVCE